MLSEIQWTNNTSIYSRSPLSIVDLRVALCYEFFTAISATGIQLSWTRQKRS